MGETETERMIDIKTDLIIKVLMENDFKGLLLMDMEGYDDKKTYMLPERTTEKIMREELNYAMDLIAETRKLAMDLNNLDLRNETFEMMMELEEDWRKVFNGIERENEPIGFLQDQFPVEIMIVEQGGAGNVFDWA